MKKILPLLLSLLVVSGAYAKKVKFSVDMNGQTINSNGVHVMGDFQVAAGYTLDFAPDLTLLTQEGSSTIYSIVLNIPAFKKYEFKFVNGDQSYDAEFVPNEARVGYFFNDNRWLYVDSLANDTTNAGAVLFSGNAPAGKSLLRYLVDMTAAGTVSNKGVHVAGNFQTAAWDATKNILYSFVTGTYETIVYVTNGTYQYKFYNGNTGGNTETVPSSCAVSGNRSIVVSKDTVLNSVCFSACTTCSLAGVFEYSLAQNKNVYPNPAADKFTVELGNTTVNYSITLSDALGNSLRSYENVSAYRLTVDRGNLPSGIYYLSVKGNNENSFSKIIFQ